MTALSAWLDERRGPLVSQPRGGPLSRDSIERLVGKYATSARQCCPSIEKKHITPHVLRHSAAMTLLQNGIDRAVIALWLGHESVQTTQIYLRADMTMKERALAKTSNVDAPPRRYHPNDELRASLKSL